jgi:ubiquitin carboxyl-terminal hydrolase L5
LQSVTATKSEPLTTDLLGWLARDAAIAIQPPHDAGDLRRQEPFVSGPAEEASEKDDVFHFVAYIPYNGKVYELDGLKPGPIKLGTIGPYSAFRFVFISVSPGDIGDDWLNSVRPAIQERIEK